MNRWIGVGVLLACLWPAAARAQTDEVVYFYTDAVGSVRMTTDGAGTVLARYDFHPFGGDAAPPVPPTPDVIQFAGKRRDAETGLSYFGARYYAGQAGRFTTVDPVLDQQAALIDPQRWNRYTYALNNPMTFTDPDGRSPKLVMLALRAGHALYKGYDVYSTVEGIVDAGGTLVSADASGWDRLLAAGTLAGELSGATDLLRAGKGLVRAVDDAAAVAARGGAKATRNVQGGIANADEALRGAEKWLGDGYKEIAPGVFRSADGTRQFRMTTSDLTDPKLGPHVHFESIGPDGRTIVENSHLLLRLK